MTGMNLVGYEPLSLEASILILCPPKQYEYFT